MTRTDLQSKLDEIRAVRNESLALLQDAPDSDTEIPTPDLRMWRNLGVVLLRFGDHMREHRNQVNGIRQSLGRGPSDVQRKLADAEIAWGQLLAAVTGLADEDLDAQPEDGGWTVRETLDHILQTEIWFLQGIKNAYDRRSPE